MQCPACHARLENPAAKFCGECGQVIPQSKPCSACGKQLKPTAKFCDECGKSVNQTSSSPSFAPSLLGYCAGSGKSIEKEVREAADPLRQAQLQLGITDADWAEIPSGEFMMGSPKSEGGSSR